MTGRNRKLPMADGKFRTAGRGCAPEKHGTAFLPKFATFNFQLSVFKSLLVVLFLSSVSPLAVRAVDRDALRRKQDAQERAREMAHQLVTGILDVQLQQLEENGLKELPVYREIAGMKKNIGALVDKEMEKAVLRCRDIVQNLLSFARKQDLGEFTEKIGRASCRERV